MRFADVCPCRAASESAIFLLMMRTTVGLPSWQERSAAVAADLLDGDRWIPTSPFGCDLRVQSPQQRLSQQR